MRALTEQTVLVTGATDGLGRELARSLVGEGATVLLHGRSEEKLAAVQQELAGGPGRTETVRADLAELRQVDALADEIAGRDRLDALVNNAGIGFGASGGPRRTSADGYELRLAVNHLAPYHLARRLAPLLAASAPARIVNVASVGQADLDLDDLQFEHGYDGVTAYRRSKLAIIMATLDLAAELADRDVTVNAIHPATLMDTPMVRGHGHDFPARSTVEDGLRATLPLVTDPALDGVTGRYFDAGEETKARPQAYDEDVRARLRAASDELIAAALR